jgi:hypothetical protein
MLGSGYSARERAAADALLASALRAGTVCTTVDGLECWRTTTTKVLP